MKHWKVEYGSIAGRWFVYRQYTTYWLKKLKWEYVTYYDTFEQAKAAIEGTRSKIVYYLSVPEEGVDNPSK